MTLMDFDPQRFFVGLMDFFSILLPGALLTWLLMGGGGPDVLGGRYVELAGAAGWAAFLFSSYLFGHLVFLLGSWLDEFYDQARHRTLNVQIQRAARGRVPSWQIVRLFVWLVFKRERNLAVRCADSIKELALEPLAGQQAINTFQWSKALLTAESPASLAVVQRFEADSKFFRCFTMVLLLLLLAWPWQQQWPGAGSIVVLALLLPAMWRYMEQRFKATNQAYWSVITLTAKAGKLVVAKPAPEPGSPTRAGGVVFRRRAGVIEYLFVEATQDRCWLVLPKGKVEAGEPPTEAAVREVHEETGIWAIIDGELGDWCWKVEDATVTTRFFLMQAVGCGLQKDKDRKREWMTLDDSAKLVSRDSRLRVPKARKIHVETHELLICAQSELSGRELST
jgi:ADP-ribose pyrophosphatase YjhB (NUDIX family)